MLAIALAIVAAACLAGVVYLIADMIVVARRGGTLLEEAARALDSDTRSHSEGVKRLFTRYTGLRFELAVAAAFIAWFCTLFGVAWLTASELAALVGSFLVGPAVLWFGLRLLSSRRKRKFEQQFVNMLQRLAAQLENGEGLAGAIEHVVVSIPEDPVGSELRVMQRALESNAPIVAIAKDIAERYESPAAEMFYRSLEANEKTGGTALADTLRTVATDLSDDLDLRKEIAAEMASAKLTAFVLVFTAIGVIVMIAIGASDIVIPMLTNPIGLIFMLLLTANIVTGIVRTFRLLGRVQRGEF